MKQMTDRGISINMVISFNNPFLSIKFAKHHDYNKLFYHIFIDGSFMEKNDVKLEKKCCKYLHRSKKIIVTRYIKNKFTTSIFLDSVLLGLSYSCDVDTFDKIYDNYIRNTHMQLSIAFFAYEAVKGNNIKLIDYLFENYDVRNDVYIKIITKRKFYLFDYIKKFGEDNWRYVLDDLTKDSKRPAI